MKTITSDLRIDYPTHGVYRKYPGQYEPQQLYVEVNPSHKTMTIDYNPEIGNAVPMDVYHGRRFWYSLPQRRISVRSARALLRSLAPLADRIVAGYSTVWNGNNNVGRLNDDATRASDELVSQLEQLDEDAY